MQMGPWWACQGASPTAALNHFTARAKGSTAQCRLCLCVCVCVSFCCPALRTKRKVSRGQFDLGLSNRTPSYFIKRQFTHSFRTEYVEILLYFHGQINDTSSWNPSFFTLSQTWIELVSVLRLRRPSSRRHVMVRKQRPTFEAALIGVNVLKEQFTSKILENYSAITCSATCHWRVGWRFAIHSHFWSFTAHPKQLKSMEARLKISLHWPCLVECKSLEVVDIKK